MPENLNMDEITEARRASVSETIEPIGIAELKALCEALFPTIDHPWREKVFAFIGENSGAAFYHAVTNDRIHIIYCHVKEKGMWFLPGSGMGFLQAKGLKILKEIIEGER